MSKKRWLPLLMLALGTLTAQSALAGRLVELSVFDRADSRRLPVYRHGDSAYVAGQPGHEYRLVLRNRTGARVLAVVSVDGVNVVTGQGADPSQSGYVIAPHGRLEIKGWRKSLAQTAAFYFTDLSDSYAARTGRPDNVGVIGVAVFREKRRPPPAPIAREAFPGAPGEAGAAKRSAPAPGRQRLERGAQRAQLLVELGAPLRLILRRRRRLERRVVGVGAHIERDELQAAPPPVIHHAVVRDGVEPGGEARAQHVALARLDHLEPDVVEQLLGLAARLDVAQHVAIERPLVPCVQRFEGRGLAVPVGDHQLLVRGLHAALV